MDIDVSVVIAYRDMGCPHRRAAFEHVREWYSKSAPGWEVVVESGTSDETFSRAVAINAAVGRAHGRVIVQTDPDSLVQMPKLYQAVGMALMSDGLTIPHDRYWYTTQNASMLVQRALLPLNDVRPRHCEFYGDSGSGNVVVFNRRTWETAGKFDERFGVWGGDDAAFRYAVEALYGPARRIGGPMVHLWHPRLAQSEPGHPEYLRQFTLLAQYRDAAEKSPQAVIDLVRSRA